VSQPIILYDGVCGLCNRAVQFALKHDHKDRFRFAPLQSGTAQRLIALNNDASKFDTIYVVLKPGQPDQKLLSQSDAVVAILNQLGGWRIFAAFFRMIPKPLRDWGYDFIARHRYRIFGKYDSCPVPSERDRHKFLD
jgi:predicted DCC family thiol-disulfide oxidoreductase YuxK